MTDPLSPFPKDTDNRLLGGVYKRVSYSDIEKERADGWEEAECTDRYFHPNDEHGIMMKWREGPKSVLRRFMDWWCA